MFKQACIKTIVIKMRIVHQYLAQIMLDGKCTIGSSSSWKLKIMIKKIIKLEYFIRINDYLAEIKYLKRASKISKTLQRYHHKQGLNQIIQTIISFIAEPAEDENIIQLIQRTSQTQENNQKQAKSFGQRKPSDNSSINWKKQKDIYISSDVV